jgi:hypothetical protein
MKRKLDLSEVIPMRRVLNRRSAAGNLDPEIKIQECQFCSHYADIIKDRKDAKHFLNEPRSEKIGTELDLFSPGSGPGSGVGNAHDLKLYFNF